MNLRPLRGEKRCTQSPEQKDNGDNCHEKDTTKRLIELRVLCSPLSEVEDGFIDMVVVGLNHKDQIGFLFGD